MKDVATSEEEVLLGSFPAVHLAPVLSDPAFMKRLSIGTDKVVKAGPGTRVFIYVSGKGSALYRKGKASWEATLAKIVPAVEDGPRKGKHPNPAVRPPSADATDTGFRCFLDLVDLKPLDPGVPLDRFKSKSGGKPFTGPTPRWPVRCILVD